MIGQGCPSLMLPRSDLLVGQGSPQQRCQLVVVALIVCALLPVGSLFAQETELDLRIEWGGGAARRWHARISVDRGSLTEPVPLGLEPDVPGSAFQVDREIRVAPRTPRTYDGVDLRLSAPFDAVLTVELIPLDAPSLPHRQEIAISSVVSNYQSYSIDDRDNSLLVRRRPGDQLRVRFDRDDLILSPGEPFPVTIVPHWAGLSAASDFDCNITMYRAASNEQVWSTQERVRSDANGNLSPVGPVQMTAPDVEGVYDVVIAVVPVRGFAARFARLKPVIQRKIQFVVISDQANPPASADWSVERVIDPAFPRWWDRISQLPQLNWITGSGSPLGNSRSRIVSYGGQDVVELDVDGWQAYPLPINDIGSPYIFEIEYPGDVPQTLGISVVEPNETGAVVPLGIDSGVDVVESLSGDSAQTALLKHRIVVWPKTSSPLLLLTNQRRDKPAIFGKIRLWSGPDRLPAVSPTPVPPSEEPRMIATQFDRPLFPEVFGAPEELDDWSKQTCDNWRTFYEGGRRLTEYLQFVGFNAAAISVFSDGATIYPSELLQPTARYDRGVFFVSGQDPVRKDVLEMLLRLFDREGLRLVAALRFSTPLPEIEEALRHGNTMGIELINEKGRTWTQEHGIKRGKAVYYNPLDPRVQQAMANVVAELADKYGHHPSFAGVSIQLGPDTYAQLPDESWGLDDQTIARFERETGVEVPGSGQDRFSLRGQYLTDDDNEEKQQWISWRAAQLAKLYAAMLEPLERVGRGTKLYISMADSISSPAMYAALHPRLPRRTRNEVTGALRRIGIDPDLYTNRPDLVLMRPQQLVAAATTAESPLSIHLRRAPQMDRLFADAANHGVQFSHVPQARGLPSFEQRSPFGRDRTQIWMVPHVSPSGVHNRRRFVEQLAARDVPTIVDGGWMPLLGQEDSLRELLEVFRSLPNVQFETVRPASDDTPVHGVVIRRKAVGERTYFYLVNDSPWPASVDIALDSLSSGHAVSLSTRPLQQPAKNDDGEVRWRIELQPYDLVGASLDSPEARIIDWQSTVPEDVSDQLHEKLADIESRIMSLDDPPPIDVVTNAGFESPVENGRIAGWSVARADEIEVEIDTKEKHHGNQSLRLSVSASERFAWVRSRPFPRPKTGRLAVFVWVKTDPSRRSPTNSPGVRWPVGWPAVLHAYQNQVRDGPVAEIHLLC